MFCLFHWINKNAGLIDEPYFKYFSYEDYLTPYSCLIHIRKYATKEWLEDIHLLFVERQEFTKNVKKEICRLVVEEFRYLNKIRFEFLSKKLIFVFPTKEK